MSHIIIILLTLVTAVTLALLFRKQLRSWLYRMRGKLHVQSLRMAIIDADKDKAKTGRKNMVVMNTTSGSFEPAQKRLLKFLAAKNKQRNNGRLTAGRKKFAKRKKITEITTEKVKQVEKNSLYVTS